MSRKNRISVHDGVYHVTARIAHRAMLLGESEIKERIMEWIVSVAEFSGVEVWSFAIMDNHLHLLVHVPPVPEELWLDRDEEPAAYAFGMRPPEVREPLWSPPAPSEGDRPLPAVRPGVGFMLDDGAMLGRLASLYGPSRADKIAERWEALRNGGLGHLVDGEKERYCRRMYNLSQYVKTLKERVSMWYNEKYGHSGSLWEGRFYSGVVEREESVKAVVAAYIGFNPVKAGLVPSPGRWRWSSYSLAVSGDTRFGAYCRRMYARMLNRPWDEVRGVLESMFADRLPDSLDAETLKAWYDDYDPDAEGPQPPGGVCRASQAIRVTMKAFRGAYIGRGMEFYRSVTAGLPKRFPRAGSRSARRCSAFVWMLPERSVA